MAIENSNTPSSIDEFRNRLFNGRPISIELKPGEPCPDGYVLVPMCPEPVGNGAPYTPAIHRFFFERDDEENIVALDRLTVGKHGKAASFMLANGKTVQLAFTKAHHADDPCLAKLPARDMKKLCNHLAG